MATPSAITDLSGVPGDTQVVLSWSAPNDGGFAITDYIVQYRIVGSSLNMAFVDANSNIIVDAEGKVFVQ